MDRRYRRPQYRVDGDGYAFSLLLGLIGRIYQLETKPPLTIFLIFINLAIYAVPIALFIFDPKQVPYLIPIYEWTTPANSCLIPHAILHGQLHRAFLSTFVHGSELHIMYNLTSFLYKGATIEAELGTSAFAFLIAFLCAMCPTLYVLIAFFFYRFEINPSMMSNCVIGFSAVIFGLKVVINSNSRFTARAERIFGFSIPDSTAWAELILASLSSPNISFFGHLCGILAGTMYVHLFAPHLRRAAQTPRSRYQ